MATTHKIIPANPRLSSLLSDVTRGNIKIPVFQREYVWDDEQIMSLLDSIYQGYPVGSLLLWSTKEPLDHERNVGGFALPETPEDFPVNYVLDGQQRLTTLFGVFNSDMKTSNAELADRFNVCFVPETEEFVHYEVADPAKSINLRVILDTTKLLPELQRFDKDMATRIATLTERFKDYEFPVVTIKDRTNQEVCRVFQRINSSGTSLSTLELLAAWTWSDQFDLRNEIETVLEALSDKGYEQLDEALLLRSLAGVVLDRIEADELVDVSPDRLIQGMQKLKQAIYATVDFLEKELRIRNIVFVPFPIMVVPLVKFFSINLKPNVAQMTSLKRWFWFVAFTQRYKAGTNIAVVEDLKAMVELANGNAPFDGIKGGIEAALFKRAWRINSTIAKATICMLAQHSPRSFLSNNLVDLSSAMSAYNSREFHHVYPKAWLATQGIGFHESNIIANVCFLSQADNRAISDQAPAIYMPKIDSALKPAIATAALLPPGSLNGSWPYNDFIADRAGLLAQAANKLIETAIA
ncbi:DUF262 domain-containing protein [Variovorax paradoxus]|uniref:GmrSD restriction endonucleases N-terminal domain-containing protein n=1 Tax=Variovorax paradoxus TaxID=34073 RepID=A0AAW8EL10_VARPD|nr:DUF262 domain-containing protein [Variovorax paradoxus]MDP9973209.1 hypothetical protein [Variovorax paradoxus]